MKKKSINWKLHTRHSFLNYLFESIHWPLPFLWFEKKKTNYFKIQIYTKKKITFQIFKNKYFQYKDFAFYQNKYKLLFTTRTFPFQYHKKIDFLFNFIENNTNNSRWFIVLLNSFKNKHKIPFSFLFRYFSICNQTTIFNAYTFIINDSNWMPVDHA